MRPQTTFRRACVRALSGAALATPFAAVAPLAVPDAQAAAAPRSLALSDSSPAYGQPVKVGGRAYRQDAGRTVVLEFADRGGSWHVLRTARVAADGRYSFTVALTRSGSLRAVLGAGGQSQAVAAQAATATPASRVAVAATVQPAARRLDVMPGGIASVAG